MAATKEYCTQEVKDILVGKGIAIRMAEGKHDRKAKGHCKCITPLASFHAFMPVCLDCGKLVAVTG